MVKISQLTMGFYDNISEAWNKSRQNKWPGWERMWREQVREIEGSELSVLDLGCGNGRLLQFYLEKAKAKELKLKYLGLDISRKLISIAQEKYGKVAGHEIRFVTCDIADVDAVQNILNLEKIQFDVVNAIAVYHHLPEQKVRRSLIELAGRHMKSGGLFTFTTWEFLSNAKTKGLIVKSEEEKGDYWLGWQGKEYLRFAHAFTEAEKQELAAVKGFGLVDSFYADGKNAKLNHYFILKKDVEAH